MNVPVEGSTIDYTFKNLSPMRNGLINKILNVLDLLSLIFKKPIKHKLRSSAVVE